MLKLYDGKSKKFNNTAYDVIQNVYDAKIEFDKGYMLTFKVAIDDEGLHKKIKNEMIVVCKTGYKDKENAFRIKDRLEFSTYVEFKCPQLFYDLDNKRTKVADGIYNPAEIIDFIKNQTADIEPFAFDYSSVSLAKRIKIGNYKDKDGIEEGEDYEEAKNKASYYNSLELVNKIFSSYECEYYFDFYTIRIGKRLGRDTESLIYEYKNIEDWESDISMDKRATRVIAQSDFERKTTYKKKYPDLKLYIHFAYGNDDKGKDFSNTNYKDKSYIGYYVDTEYKNSSNSKDFKWVSMKIPKESKNTPAFTGDRKIKGITTFMVGSDYRDGIPIKLDKKTFYLHTAFANYLDGNDININDGTGAKYVGFMMDDKKDNTRVKEVFTFNHLTEEGGMLINDRRELTEKVHLETVVESPLINRYAQIYTDTYVDNELKTEKELQERVEELFNQGLDKPKRTIKCKIKRTDEKNRYMLSSLDSEAYTIYTDDVCELYDSLILRYLSHGIDERIGCVGFEYDPIAESVNYLLFGSKDKENSLSASMSSGVSAKLDQEMSDLAKYFEEKEKYYDELLQKGREEFSHIWLSEKIDFINSFNEYGEYAEDIGKKLDEIEEERQQKTQELEERLSENDRLLEEATDSLSSSINNTAVSFSSLLYNLRKDFTDITNNLELMCYDANKEILEINKGIETINSNISSINEVFPDELDKVRKSLTNDIATINDTITNIDTSVKLLDATKANISTVYTKEETDDIFSRSFTVEKYNEFKELYEEDKATFSQSLDELKSRITKSLPGEKYYSDLDQTIDTIKTEIAKISPLENKYTSLKQTVDGIETKVVKITDMESRISSLSQSVDGMQASISKVDENEQKISEINQTIDTIQTKIANITDNEAKIANLTQTVEGIQTEVAKITSNETKISKLTQTVDSLQTLVASLDSGLDSKIASIIEQKKDSIVIGIGSVTGLSTRLNALESSISVHREAIDLKASNIDLQGKVSFTDLNSKGYGKNFSTFIDGSKIMTGTVNSNQITSASIMAKHLYVDSSMITKLNTNHLLAKEVIADSAFVNYIEAKDIKANRIITGRIKSRSNNSWIDLDDGKFSFYNESISTDETFYDSSVGSYRARVHIKGSMRVSAGDNPVAEFNSGGLTLFKDGEYQSSKGTNKIQSNSRGNIQMGSIDSSAQTNIYAEIGSYEGYVMHVYGSLRVHRNLRVDSAIRYGSTCQQGTSF